MYVAWLDSNFYGMVDKGRSYLLKILVKYFFESYCVHYARLIFIKRPGEQASWTSGAAA